MKITEALVRHWLHENGFPQPGKRVVGGMPLMTYKEFQEYPLEDLFQGGCVNEIRKLDVVILCGSCGANYHGWFIETREYGVVRGKRDHICP